MQKLVEFTLFAYNLLILLVIFSVWILRIAVVADHFSMPAAVPKTRPVYNKWDFHVEKFFETNQSALPTDMQSIHHPVGPPVAGQ